MRTDRLQYLVKQYRLTQSKLRKLQERQTKLEVSFEVFKDLERELNNEVASAKISKDSAGIKFWQSIIKEYLDKDVDKVSEAQVKKAQKEAGEKNLKIIRYYQRKLKVIAQLLGARETEIVESYEQKNIMLGEQASSGGHLQQLEEEEEEDLRRVQKSKNSATFDKL